MCIKLSKDKAILPISYFGPLEYYAILLSHDTVIESHENYQKRSVRNRSQILSANGILTLSVPLNKGKTLKQIKEVEISYSVHWQKQHIRAIRSAYESAPYFDHYWEQVRQIINHNWTYLYDLNLEILSWLHKVGFIGAYKFTNSYMRAADYKLDKRPTSSSWNQVFPHYNQVFEAKFGYLSNLSILDGIFNLGPELRLILKHE